MSGGNFFARHFVRKEGGYMMYHRLENSIIDVIKEEQAKLGYRKEEIRLYYPLSSLDHFFETEADAEEMKKDPDRIWCIYKGKTGQCAGI